MIYLFTVTWFYLFQYRSPGALLKKFLLTIATEKLAEILKMYVLNNLNLNYFSQTFIYQMNYVFQISILCYLCLSLLLFHEWRPTPKSWLDTKDYTLWNSPFSCRPGTEGHTHQDRTQSQLEKSQDEPSSFPRSWNLGPFAYFCSPPARVSKLFFIGSLLFLFLPLFILMQPACWRANR